MQQLELGAPLMTLARDKGERLAQACADKAERVADWDREGAARFIHHWLVRHGPTSGEQLVKQATAHGYRAHDGRAYGAVFGALSRAGKIRCLRSDLPRERGHGTSGGKLWEAT